MGDLAKHAKDGVLGREFLPPPPPGTSAEPDLGATVHTILLRHDFASPISA